MHVALVGALVLVVFLAIAVLLLVLNDRMSALVWRFRNPPGKVAAQELRYEERLRSPDWVFYESHLQRLPPAALREAFLSEGLRSRAHQFSDFHIAFAPIDRTALTDAWVLPGIVPFAESDGDPICLRPDATTADVVFIAFHDGGDTEELAPSVEAFLAGLKNAA